MLKKAAPTPTPAAPPAERWLLVVGLRGRLRANTWLTITSTETVGVVPAVAVRAMAAVISPRSEDNCVGLGNEIDNGEKHGVWPRNACSYRLKPLLSNS